jgi:hypothetical protein
VPKVAAGVYTVWEDDRLIYVGMSGRALTSEDIDAPDEPTKAKGLWWSDIKTLDPVPRARPIAPLPHGQTLDQEHA